MLRLDGVHVQLGARVLLDGVDLRLSPGDRVALVGRNGAGKSTLLRTAVGLLPPDGGEVGLGKGETVGYLAQEHLVEAGRTVWEEAWAVLAPVVALGRQAQELLERASAEKDPADREALLHEAEVLQERFRRLDGWKAEATCGRVLAGLGFRRDEWDKPSEALSGGRQVTLGLVRLLLEDPTYLLLDEPTNHLDIETRTWLLHELKGRKGGVLLISHDRWFLDRLADRTLEIEDGGLTQYAGGYTAYLKQRAEAEERRRVTAEAQQAELDRLEAFVTRFKAKATKASQARSRMKQIDRLEAERVQVGPRGPRARLRFPDPPPASSPMLELRGLRKAYGEHVVLREVDLSVYPGERILLVGPNGAGKSTLLQLVASRIRADRGVVEELPGTRIAWFAQDQTQELHPDHSVLQSAAEADSLLTETRLRSLLGALLFRGDDVDKPCRVLSGGEKSRLALARVLLRRANLLVLDEPTNHLDIETKDVLAEALQAWPGTLLFVSHDRAFADQLATGIWEVGGGLVRAHHGGLDDFLWGKAMAAGLVRERGPGQPAPDSWLLGGLPEAADHAQAVPGSLAGASSGAEAWKEQKRRANEEKRLQKKAEATMERIERIEESIGELDERMAGAGDRWELLAELAQERAARESELQSAWAEWEAVDAELSGGTSA